MSQEQQDLLPLTADASRAAAEKTGAKKKAKGHVYDIGQRIEGARKHKTGRINRDDIARMDPDKRVKLMTKNKIWPTPKYAELVNQGGYTVRAAAMVKMLRDVLPAAPYSRRGETEADAVRRAEAFTSIVNAARDVAESGKTEEELAKALREQPAAQQYIGVLGEGRVRGALMLTPLAGPQVHSDAFGYPSYAVASTVSRIQQGELSREMDAELRENPQWPNGNTVVDQWIRKQELAVAESPTGWRISYRGTLPSSKESWAYRRMRDAGFENPEATFAKSEEADAEIRRVANEQVGEKRSAAKEKQERLERLAFGEERQSRRVGPDYGATAKSSDYLDGFRVRGVQFGLWLNDLERQDVMNRGLEAFKDLGMALKFGENDISLGGHLAIAFGARGNGHASAHYEPSERVINLTKPRGAGALAHEYGHALDHRLGLMAQELGMVSRLRDVSEGRLLTNMILSPRVGEEDEQRKFVRQIHAGMESIWRNASPRTKDEALESVDQKLTAQIASLKAYLTAAEGEMARAGVTPERIAQIVEPAAIANEPIATLDREKFNEVFTQIRQEPEVKVTYAESGMHSRQVLASDLMVERARTLALPENWSEPCPPRRTAYVEAVSKLDGMRSSGSYFSKPEEMFARAFESAVFDELESKGIASPFLVDGTHGMAFPKGRERQAFRKMMLPLIEKVPQFIPRPAAPVPERPVEVEGPAV